MEYPSYHGDIQRSDFAFASVKAMESPQFKIHGVMQTSQIHAYIILYSKTGVYRGYYFSYFAKKNIDCGYLLEPPRWGSSNEYPQSMFWAEKWKILEFFIWKFSFLDCKIFNIFE